MDSVSRPSTSRADSTLHYVTDFIIINLRTLKWQVLEYKMSQKDVNTHSMNQIQTF